MQVLNPSPIDVIRTMTHDDLYLYKRCNSNASFRDLITYDNAMQDSNKNGAIFVSPSKVKLSEGKGFVVTSYETIEEQYNDLSHWTPNIFRGGTYYNFKERKIKGHSKDNLKQINVIGFDIDTKEVDLYGLLLGCDELNLPRPNLLLETPRGYQGFYILETPFYIHKNQNYKALRVAERLAENVLEALNKYAPVDMNCNQFGFYRVPNDENVIYFDDEMINTNSLIDWSKQYEHEERKKKFKVIYGGENSSESQYISSDWYRALIQTTNIGSGEYTSSRNNALLTLALANYADGVSLQGAYDVLDQWNSNLSNPLSLREFERVLNSAYSGKYKGVQRSYVESLLENWTDGSASFDGQKGWYKFAKPREERERSHYHEREQDIVIYINDQTSPENPFIEGSLRELAEQLNIPLSTLKEVLKQSKGLYKKTEGKGRGAKTILTTKSMLMKHLLEVKKDEKIQTQMMLFELVQGEQKLNNEQNKPKTIPCKKEVISYRDTS